MSSVLESPRRSVKTYSKKKKRIQDANSDMNASDSSEEEVEETSPKKAKGKKLSDMRPPEINSRQTDLAHPPKPSSEKSSNKKHVRSSSSVSSLKQVERNAPINSSPSSSRKPPSVRAAKPVSSATQNMNPSESEMDDGASVADSVMTTTRVRRTEAERIAYYKNQPECDSLEPHRVKCLRCQKIVSLGSKQTYAVRPWELHRAKCDQKVPSSVMLSQGASPSASVAEVAASESGRVRKSEAERKAILLADPRAVEVKPDEIKCKQCQKWIRLSSNASQRYALHNWNVHQARCSDVVPSNKVAAASRKLKIVNDPQAKSYGPRHVDCASCGTTVELQGEGDYNLACWEQHKTECSGAAAGSSRAQVSGETATVSTTAQMAQPPPSVESASTVVAQDGASRGTKRRLEEELTSEDPDGHVNVRPRTETYITPEKEPPSALGWFLMPIKSFVRGFKESLSHD